MFCSLKCQNFYVSKFRSKARNDESDEEKEIKGKLNKILDKVKNGQDLTDEEDEIVKSTKSHVAGTIGAVGNNNLGISGVSWNSKIMALKYLDSDGSGVTSGAIELLNYVYNMKVNHFALLNER